MHPIYPKDLSALIAQLKKLPGVGQKTAGRYAFELLKWDADHLNALADLLSHLKTRLICCSECGCLMEDHRCLFCSSQGRKQDLLCIIGTPRDVYSIEQTKHFLGLYHVLGSLISPLDGQMPSNLNLPHLKRRIQRLNIREVILALDSTLEGDATSLFLSDHLRELGIQVSRLALGLPIGSCLDYVDEGTLAQALTGRQKL